MFLKYAKNYRHDDSNTAMARWRGLACLKHGLEDGDEHARRTLPQLLEGGDGLRRYPHTVEQGIDAGLIILQQ